MKKYILSLTCLLMTLPATSAELTAKDRFEALIAGINSNLPADVDNFDVDALASGALRKQFLSIETMADLYGDRYPELSKVESIGKSLEDEIGAYRQRGEAYDHAVSHGADAGKIASLKRSKETAREGLVSFIKSRGWAAHGKQVRAMQEVLDSVRWASAEDDRAYAINGLSEHLSKLGTTRWDMTDLHSHIGVHAFKKEIRSFRLELSAMKDLVSVSDNQCGIKNQKGGSCRISSCYLNPVAEAYEPLDVIKTAGEGQEGRLSAEQLRDLQEIYESLSGPDVFNKMSAELETCIK